MHMEKKLSFREKQRLERLRLLESIPDTKGKTFSIYLGVEELALLSEKYVEAQQYPRYKDLAKTSFLKQIIIDFLEYGELGEVNNIYREQRVKEISSNVNRQLKATDEDNIFINHERRANGFPKMSMSEFEDNFADLKAADPELYAEAMARSTASIGADGGYNPETCVDSLLELLNEDIDSSLQDTNTGENKNNANPK